MIAATETSEWIVFLVVAAARLFVPLMIPIFPLPGILAALILDAVDQTIFQQFPGLKLEGYQGYDKALDIYYLTIAYISTLRNWENHFAFKVSRFLFYWRLVGVALFELSHLRVLLLIFPNAFEYFFIFYEAYRLRWSSKRMTKKLVVGAAAFIWIVIKIPQEYWIHIAQTDTTDWLKSRLFDLPIDTPWIQIFNNWNWFFVIAFVILIGLLFAIWRLISRYLPPADRDLAFSADAHRAPFSTRQVRSAFSIENKSVMDTALLEKIVLISLVGLCFAQVLPGVYSNDLQLTIGVTLVVIIDTVLSHRQTRIRFGWAFSLGKLIFLALFNFGLILAYAILRSLFADPLRIMNVLFYAFLLTVLVTLFDRYRLIYLMRFGSIG